MTFTPLKQYPNFGTTHVVPLLGYPTVIADGATWNSDLLPAGFAGAIAAILSDHAGTLQIQRYADLAGLLPVGVLITQAVVANTPASAGAVDGRPFLAFNVAFVNASGAAANIAAFSIITGPSGGT